MLGLNVGLNVLKFHKFASYDSSCRFKSQKCNTHLLLIISLNFLNLIADLF